LPGSFQPAAVHRSRCAPVVGRRRKRSVVLVDRPSCSTAERGCARALLVRGARRARTTSRSRRSAAGSPCSSWARAHADRSRLDPGGREQAGGTRGSWRGLTVVPSLSARLSCRSDPRDVAFRRSYSAECSEGPPEARKGGPRPGEPASSSALRGTAPPARAAIRGSSHPHRAGNAMPTRRSILGSRGAAPRRHGVPTTTASRLAQRPRRARPSEPRLPTHRHGGPPPQA
jgi:hypothetical protein